MSSFIFYFFFFYLPKDLVLSGKELEKKKNRNVIVTRRVSNLIRKVTDKGLAKNDNHQLKVLKALITQRCPNYLIIPAQILCFLEVKK